MTVPKVRGTCQVLTIPLGQKTESVRQFRSFFFKAKALEPCVTETTPLMGEQFSCELSAQEGKRAVIKND
jgi:hypothetical protein